MATQKQFSNRLIFIILNIVILIELCSTAPTMIPQNLIDLSNIIYNENITKESTTLMNSLSIIEETNLTTEFPSRYNRNTTKPLPVQKSKKQLLTKNLNTKKIKEKNLKYSISNVATAKLQINNNSVKNKTEMLTVLPPLLTTTDKSILTEDRNLETKVLTKNLNHVNSKINNNNDKAEEIPIVSTLSSLTTISPVTVTEKNNLNISYLNKPNDFKVTKDDYITTSIPIQTISIPEKQSGVVEFSTSHTTDELITTESVGTINDNEKVLQNDTTEISIPSTININIQQGLQHNIKMEEFLLANNSIVISTEIDKNGTDTYSIPIVNYTNLNIEEIIPITIAIEISSPSTLVSTSDLIITSTQTNLSNKLISQLTTIEVDKDNVTSLVAPTQNPDNNTVIAGTLNSNNSEQIITLDSVVITNKNTEINNESITISTNVEVNINTEKPIEITTITNNQVKNQSGMGHDGVKITKKKQLVEKHFKNDEFVKNSKIDNASSSENINNKTIKKLDIKENSLGPIIMKEEILMTTQTPQENNINKEKSIASTTDTLYVDKENIEEFTTETLEDEQNTTILIPKISQIDSITTDIPGLSTTTENELIKHKIFEKSLISKMEWIPIENIDRSLVNTFDNKIEKLDIIEQSTILPIQLTSSNEHEIKPKIKTNTKFTPTLKTKLKTELDPKSLEIELIESPLILSSDKNIKSVPEFFEIATSKQHPNNNNKETDSSPIEIQINVSEGFGNETENLEFSFRQQPKQQQQKHIVHHHPPPGFQEIGEITIQRTSDLNTLQPISDYKQKKSNENDEILQVEITAIDNTTKIVDEKQIEMFNDTPKFTVHNEQNLDIRENDDFFVPDLKMDPIDDTGIVSGKNLDNSDRDSVDQDSDTIFYISNTEVKVVESLPTIQNANNHSELNNIRNIKNISQDSNRSKLESQFFPAIYEEDVLIDTPPVVDPRNESKIKSLSKEVKLNSQKDDIILSPIKKLLEPLRMNQKDMHDEIILNSAEKSYKSAAATAAAAAPDVSYVGETFIEIEESTSIPNYDFKENRKMSAETHAIIKTTTSTKRDTDLPVMIMDADMNSSGALLSEVIIQPAVVPEMSIGVPVIGELPPQIELKEIDFLPDTNNGGGKENHDKLIDAGSIQYGADLIADETELNDNPNRYIFESGYPFTDEKINRVGRVRNNEDIDVLDRDINDDSENDDMMATSQQIVMHAVDNLQREQLIADLPSDSWDDGYKEIPIKRNNPKPNKNIVVIGDNNTNYINNSTNFLNSTGVNGTELLGNATAFSILEENDGTDFNLTDIQTLIIACFATLVPLILSLLTAFGLRYLWIKYRRDHDEGSGLVGDSSTDPLAAKSVAISQDELQTTESGYTLNRSNDTLESNTDITGRTSGTIIDGGGVIVNGVGHDGISQYTNGLGGDVITVSTNQSNGNAMTNKNLSNHCGANGSVTTMTLKNNHLIVETEERNDISRDARETKMHYTSSEKDGVFVVEVARGADSTGAPSGSPHKDLNNHNQKSYNIDIDKIEQQKQQSSTQDECNHEEVQIHQPPTDPNTLIEVDEPIESPFNSDKYKKCSNLGNSNTGLSQSDLSSSSDDSNKAYSYGKQELYTIPMNGGYSPSSLQQKIISPQILEYFEKDGITEKRIPEIETKENNYNNNIISNNKDNSESKPFITAALLKQDTINELTSVTSATKQNLKMNCDENKKCNGNTTDKIKSESNNDEIGDAQNFDVHKIVPDDIVDYKKLTQIDEQNRTNYKNGINNADEKISGLDQEIIQQTNPIVIDNNEKNANTNGSKENYDEIENQDNCINGENGFDSIISLPEPPSTEEIKEMNDIILMENSQLDSLPPPPPPLTECQTVTTTATPAITINTNGNSFSNNIKSIPESIVEEDDNKLMAENENCDDDDDKTILTLSTSKEELHPINELKNGIGGGGTIMTAPLAVTGSS